MWRAFTGKYGHVLWLWTGLWCLCLLFFPTWLFESQEAGHQQRALLTILLWIGVSLGVLAFWLTSLRDDEAEGGALPVPPKKQTATLLVVGLAIGLLNLIPATYPMTSSGDEAFHASTFRMLGKVGAMVAERLAPGFGMPALAAGIAALGAMGWLWWRLVHTRHRRVVLLLSWAALLLGVVVVIIVLPRIVGTLVSAEFPGYQAGQMRGFVRFPPLAKFIWLPVSLFWSDSVFAMRLPSLVCWLLSGVVLHRIIGLRDSSWMALLPALLLLVLPGMFYFGHLVYLTAPMMLLWCLALYGFEAYRVSHRRIYLVWLALALSAGLLLRRETIFLSLALLLFEGLRLLKNRTWTKEQLIDGVALGWFGVSLIPLWSVLSEARPANLNWSHLFDPARVLAIAGDFPYHIGPVAMLVLLFACFIILRRRGHTYYSPAVLALGGLVVGLSYGFFTLDYIIPDARMIGVLPLSRCWQTAHRFLVSWSPFIALILAEGVAQLPGRKSKRAVGLALGVVLLAQATFWAAPLTLPDFTSIVLRPNVERPHFPDAEVVEYVERELVETEKRILTSPELGLNYHRRRLAVAGVWIPDQWAPREDQSIDDLITYCRHNDIDIVVLPLYWTPYMRTQQAVTSAVLEHERFTVRKIFYYQGEPAIVVAEFFE